MQKRETQPLAVPQDELSDEDLGLYSEKLAKALAQNDALKKQPESTEDSKP